MKNFLTLLLVALVGSLQAETPAKKSGQSTGATSKSKSSSSQKSGSTGTKSSSASTKSNQKSGSKSSTSTPDKTETAKSEPKAETKPETAKETATEGPETEGPPVAAVSSIEVEDIQNFEHYAPQIQELIRQSLALTKLNLTYTFGSADPKKGGMDCSGTIYYVLHEFGFKDVPRQSNEMAGWVKDKTLLNRVEKADTLEHPEFASLQPGNLLFWSGTYNAGPREIPVTHVMLYLGKLKKSGKHVVFGASDGRAYQGKRRTGVSVFDFSLPRSTSSAKFYGYGMIPGVGKITPKITAVAAAPAPAEPEATEPKVEEPAPKTTTVTKTTETAAKSGDKEKPAALTAKAEKTEPTPTSKKAVTSTSTQLAAAQVKEEVRPAIRVEPEDSVADTAKKEEPVVATPKTTAKKSTSSTAKAPAKTASKSSSSRSTAKRSTTPSKSNNKSRTTSRPAEPTTLDKAKRGVGNFINDVRRAF